MNTLQSVQYKNQSLEVDSTSYVYANSKESVPLANFFLNIKYLNSNQEAQVSGKADKLGTTLYEKARGTNRKIDFQYSDAILLIIIALFSLLAFVRISGKNYLNRIFISISNYSYSNSFFKEKNLAYTLNNYILLLVFYISAAMFIGVIVEYMNIPVGVNGKWKQMFLFLIILLIGIVFYKLIYRLFGLFIGNYSLSAEFLFFFSNTLKILGFFYVIILFGSQFSSGNLKAVFIYMGIFATLIIFFIKIYRILVIFLRNRFPLYYMILYFCALEIIPAVLIIKILWLISRGNYTFSGILV